MIATMNLPTTVCKGEMQAKIQPHSWKSCTITAAQLIVKPDTNTLSQRTEMRHPQVHAFMLAAN
eukprot:699344-Amphidinium_carterae.1